MDARPQIRDEIEALPVAGSAGGQFLLYDRSGLTDAQLAVSAGVMFLLARLDGATPLLDLTALYERETGEPLPLADLEGLLAQLDQALFLQNDNFRACYDRIRRDFLAAPVRPAICAGSAYPADPQELRAFLDQILRDAPPVEEPGRVSTLLRPTPRGLIAPHMDFHRAAACYGQVYRELSRFRAPEAVVILGTAHQPLRHRYALCPKDFSVPGGVVRHHPELTRELQERCLPVANFIDDILAHRFEHSVELQAVWLRHLWGDAVRIVPLLAGSPAEYLLNPAAAALDPQIAALRSVLQDFAGRRILLLASADLAHTGPRFGDARRLERTFLEESAQADRAYLRSVTDANAPATLQSLADHGDRYHLCGTGCILALKLALDPLVPRGRLLGYQQAVTPELEQAVSCAGVLFE